MGIYNPYVNRLILLLHVFSSLANQNGLWYNEKEQNKRKSIGNESA